MQPNNKAVMATDTRKKTNRVCFVGDLKPVYFYFKTFLNILFKFNSLIIEFVLYHTVNPLEIAIIPKHLFSF